MNKYLGLFAACLTASCAATQTTCPDLNWIKEIDLKPKKVVEKPFFNGTTLGLQIRTAGREFLAKTDGLQREEKVLEAMALINSEFAEGDDADVSITGYWGGDHFVICGLYAQTNEVSFSCQR